MCRIPIDLCGVIPLPSVSSNTCTIHDFRRAPENRIRKLPQHWYGSGARIQTNYTILRSSSDIMRNGNSNQIRKVSQKLQTWILHFHSDTQSLSQGILLNINKLWSPFSIPACPCSINLRE